ncbi:MAG: gamma-glutamyltransferase family protein [Spirochaeta sp.]
MQISIHQRSVGICRTAAAVIAISLAVTACGQKDTPEDLIQLPVPDDEPAAHVPSDPSGISGVAHRTFEDETSGYVSLPRENRSSGYYAAAARDPLAAEVGRSVLENGGTAADAAVAIGVAISVSEPHFSHALGGGTWALYYNADDDRVRALDGVGRSGSLVELEFFQDPERNTPLGPHRVIVPGAWDAWMIMLRDEGSMHLDELLAPAIRMAEEGVPASRSMTGFIIQERDRIRQFPATADIFLANGSPPQVGDHILQQDLAQTLQELSDAYREAHDDLIIQGEITAATAAESRRRHGIEAARDYYYRGPIARRLSSYLLQNGGFVTEQDFAGFEAEWREPVFTHYRDTLLYGSPPNSQGASMLMAMNILENLDLTEGPDSPASVHRIIEATKLAKIDTWHYIAEPGSMPVQVEHLLSKEYAEEQARRISDNSVITWPADGGIQHAEGNNTTMFAVVDAEGNAAAVTTSTGAQFLVGGDTGILLNQRMEVMEVAEDNPNRIAPNKKPRHTVNPYMAFRDGRFLVAGGNTGFDTQPQGQIQQFLNLIEFGLSPQQAVSRRRYITHAFPSSQYPHTATNKLFLEPGFPASFIEDLQDRGHDIGTSGIIGNANLIYWNPETDQLQFGADPRGENRGFTGGPGDLAE